MAMDEKFCSLWQNDSASAIAQRVGEERNLPSDYIAALEACLEYEISLREGFESDPNSWFSVLQLNKACPKQDAVQACWSYMWCWWHSIVYLHGSHELLAFLYVCKAKSVVFWVWPNKNPHYFLRKKALHQRLDSQTLLSLLDKCNSKLLHFQSKILIVFSYKVMYNRIWIEVLLCVVLDKRHLLEQDSF